MERFLVIVASAIVGTAFFLWFSRAVKQPFMGRYILSHQWLLHPNAICYWRTGLAFVGFGLYFFSPWQWIAIFIGVMSVIIFGIYGSGAEGTNFVYMGF